MTPTITFPASVSCAVRLRIMDDLADAGFCFAHGYSWPPGEDYYSLAKGDRQAAFAALPMTLPQGVRVEGFEEKT